MSLNSQKATVVFVFSQFCLLLADDSVKLETVKKRPLICLKPSPFYLLTLSHDT